MNIKPPTQSSMLAAVVGFCLGFALGDAELKSSDDATPNEDAILDAVAGGVAAYVVASEWEETSTSAVSVLSQKGVLGVFANIPSNPAINTQDPGTQDKKDGATLHKTKPLTMQDILNTKGMSQSAVTGAVTGLIVGAMGSLVSDSSGGSEGGGIVGGGEPIGPVALSGQTPIAHCAISASLVAMVVNALKNWIQTSLSAMKQKLPNPSEP